MTMSLTLVLLTESELRNHCGSVDLKNLSYCLAGYCNIGINHFLILNSSALDSWDHVGVLNTGGVLGMVGGGWDLSLRWKRVLSCGVGRLGDLNCGCESRVDITNLQGKLNGNWDSVLVVLQIGSH